MDKEISKFLNLCPVISSPPSKDLLKVALFEICKTEFDEQAALFRLVQKHGTLVVDLFGDNPPEVWADLEDFYEFEEYEDSDEGECCSFIEWAEYFENKKCDELAQLIFQHLPERLSTEQLFAILLKENKELLKVLSIKTAHDLNNFMRDHEYEDDLLMIEQDLDEWKSFFDHDEFDLYDTCRSLKEQNEALTSKLDRIRDLLNEEEL